MHTQVPFYQNNTKIIGTFRNWIGKKMHCLSHKVKMSYKLSHYFWLHIFWPGKYATSFLSIVVNVCACVSTHNSFLLSECIIFSSFDQIIQFTSDHIFFLRKMILVTLSMHLWGWQIMMLIASDEVLLLWTLLWTCAESLHFSL